MFGSYVQRFRKEVLVMHMIGILNHPNIMPLLGIDSTHWREYLPCLVTPWLNHGTAMKYLKMRIVTMSDDDIQALVSIPPLQLPHNWSFT